MNDRAKHKIERESRVKDQVVQTVREADELTKELVVLRNLIDDFETNAHWGNAAEVFVSFIEAALKEYDAYQSGIQSEKDTLDHILRHIGEARNDQRNGLVYCEKMFRTTN